jgi:phasin family protein
MFNRDALKKEECVMAEKVSTKDTVERMSAATTEAANGMQHSYANGLKGVQDYNKKWLEFAQANTQAAMEFWQKLSGAKSPSEFIELSTNNAQRQLSTLTEQTKELGELAQKATLAAVEPLKTGFAKTFRD